MIKANEIRVGNWLNDPRPLTEFNKKYTNNPDNGYFKAKARDIQFAEIFEPIPLTEEILLKCGFRKRYIRFGYWYFIDILKTETYLRPYIGDRYIFGLNIDQNCDCEFFDARPISYLHQLQNLYFALTGQELEINL